jgi:BirA family biotin operon repressor/biotin-[acetyl-CoA-carboxylase] ligase
MRDDIKQIHLSQCNSTQDYLKIHLDNLLSEAPNILVSCNDQAGGKGRSGNFWHSYNNNLSFSFNLAPNKETTLTSLEVGIHICHYFNDRFNKDLKLKWPNDLIFDQGKCGGILIQGNGLQYIVGVGINLSQEDEAIRHDTYKHSFLFSHNIFAEDFKKLLPEKILESILENRLEPETVISEWLKLCSHMNQPVSYEEGNEFYPGTFIGIGNQGEALIDTGSEVKKIYSGSLKLIPIPQ